jgi:spore maturation protein CgeB
MAVIGKRNHLHLDEHVADAAVDAGHDVRHYQFNVRPARHALARAGLRLLARRRGASVGDAWHAAALARDLAGFRPEVVLFVSVFFIPRGYLEAVRGLSCAPRVVGWDGDALARFEDSQRYVGLMDLLGVTEGPMVADARARFGRAIYLPYAVNPRIYRDGSGERQLRAYFCGARTADRAELLARLNAVPMTVRGPGWERFTPADPALRVQPGKVSMQQQAADYASHLAVWNQHQKENNPHGSLNMRDFEATAAGALLVSDHREHMHDHFDVGEEVLMYREEEELEGLLTRCLAEPERSRHMAARAGARCREHNTYRHRVQAILDAL